MDNEVLIGGGSSFMSYIFSFSEGEKVELLNMFQYILLAIIPIMLLFKLMNTYLPILDKKKSSIEMTIEVVVQLVVLFSFFFFIHKLILFIPTYTKQPYPTLQFLPVVLPVLFILFSFDKNLSEKVNIVFNRFLVMIGFSKENFEECGSSLDDNKKKQPQVNQNVGPQFSNGSYSVAPPPQFSNPVTNTYDQMYEQPTKKSDNEQMPQQYGLPQYINEPVAANEVGFSAF